MDSDTILPEINNIFSSNSSTKDMTIDYDSKNKCYHIYNRNDYIYFDIYVKVKNNNDINLKIDRNIVRHDDSVVLRNVIDIDTQLENIHQYIKQI